MPFKPHTPDVIAERIKTFRSLEERGLVVRHMQPNGSASLSFPQPNHVDVLAFMGPMEGYQAANPDSYPGLDPKSIELIDSGRDLTAADVAASPIMSVLPGGAFPPGMGLDDIEVEEDDIGATMPPEIAAALAQGLRGSSDDAAKAIMALLAARDKQVTKTWITMCQSGPKGMAFALFVLTKAGLARDTMLNVPDDRGEMHPIKAVEILDYEHRAVQLLTHIAMEAAKAGNGPMVIDEDGHKWSDTDVQTRH